MMEDTAIVLTAFGTSTSAATTYDIIDKDIKQSFPGIYVVWAFTSHKIRSVMQQKGEPWKSPEDVLLELAQKGCKKAILQSLHIVPGFEYEKMVSACRNAPIATKLGKPLLWSENDCKKVIDALEQYIRLHESSVVVLVGHGTYHAQGIEMYTLFRSCLYKRFSENVYLCMVEGEPSWNETSPKVQKSNIQQVLFLPFMLVAGTHITNDVLNNHDSWTADLKGYRIRASREGLGHNARIRDIYKEHIRCALEEF